MEGREAHTWRKRGRGEKGKGWWEEWNTGKSGKKKGEEHREEGEPGGGQRNKEIGR